jgi:hypothetical protein
MYFDFLFSLFKYIMDLVTHQYMLFHLNLLVIRDRLIFFLSYITFN